MSVDRLRPFYEEDTGRRSQTGQTTNNADIGSAITEEENKSVNDPEQLPTLGWVSRSQIVSKNLRSICDKHTKMLRLEKRVTGKDRKALVS